MNRRDFLKFLGGAAAAAAVAPQMLAEAASTGSSGFSGATGVTGPQGSPGPIGPECIVLDYTMTVQQAIDALPQEGGTVYIKSGAYIVNQEISIPQNVRLVAEGNLTVVGCIFRGKPRPDAPIVLLMEEDDNVEIIGNIFKGEESNMPNWFEVPIGDHLAALREKMERLCLKAKQLVT